MTIDTNCRFRIMDNNFADLESSKVSKSSELAAFPASNAINNKLRSKTWVTSGYFKIDDSNKNIYINDGTDKTAVITTSSTAYTTPDLLAAEITAKLNSVSSGWTCSYIRSEENFVFGFFHASATLKLSNRTNAIWDTIGFTSNIDDSFTNSTKATDTRIHTSEFIEFDLSFNAQIDFIAMIGPLDEKFPLTKDAVITVKANNLKDRWDTAPLSFEVESTEFGIFKFLDDIEDTSFRHWRIEVSNPNHISSNGPSLHFGYIYLGDYVSLTKRNIESGFTKVRTDKSIMQTSESGVSYFDKKTKFVEYSNIGVKFIDKEQRFLFEKLFRKTGVVEPFFISLDPKLKIDNFLWENTRYVRFKNEPKFNHIKGEYYNISIELIEVI